MSEENREDIATDEETAETDEFTEPEENEELPAIPPTLRETPEESGEETETETEPEPEVPDANQIEQKIRREIALEKAAKTKSILKVCAVAAAAVFIIGIGLFAFWQCENYSSGYIMTLDGEKISVEEFKFHLMMAQSYSPKEEAVERLAEYLIYEKEAKARNITIPQDIRDEYNEHIDNFIGYGYPFEKLEISRERLVEIFAIEYLFYELFDKVLEELNFTFSEEELAEELAAYKASVHDYIDVEFKYILTETKESSEEARGELTAGTSETDEIIKKYSEGYDSETADVPLIRLSEISILTTEQTEHLLSLEVSQISDIIEISDPGGDFYLVFIVDDIIIPTQEEIDEIEEGFREYYIEGQKSAVFFDEYNIWKEETEIIIDEKALNNFDVEKFWDFIDG
ncbi:MAG: hypothetical protein FWH10_07540 [Oscillospiraceae bacterium]|nr:hypothetical protein [Oscillospiraceae bacterium]